MSLTAVAPSNPNIGNPNIVRKSLFALAIVGTVSGGVLAWPHAALAQDIPQHSSASAAPTTDDAYAALRDYARSVADADSAASAPIVDRAGDDHAAFVHLHDYAMQLAGGHSSLPVLAAKAGEIPVAASDASIAALKDDDAGHAGDGTVESGAAWPADHADFVRLHAYAQTLAGDHSLAAAAGEFRVADADNAFDALREFLQQHNGDAASSPPSAKAPAPPAPPAPHATPQHEVAATYVGNKACLGCHAKEVDLFKYTMMGRLQMQGKMQCETCHGPGSEHVRLGGGRGVGGIISFRSDDTSRAAEENNAICIGCHKRGEQTMWEGSVHQTRGLACTDCHAVMRNVSAQHQLKTAFEPDTCFQCHKDRRAQMFRSAHMPMREGKIACSDCHNPHGSITEAMIREDSINDNCYKCHAEKRGPFLFEHAPVRENCLNCHDPHGSVNEFSLKMSMPRLCFECHTLGPHGTLGRTGPGSVLTMGNACQNCHTMIHGSNSPAGGALER